MKVITIGRGDDNQIVLEDNQDMISRQHATLRIYETGKMEIVSTGSNGTFVNGFRIKPNMPYKVTRKDVISFAHVRQLDWALVPDPFRLARYSIIGAVVAAIVAVVVVLLWPEKKPEPYLPAGPEMNVVPADNKPSKPKEETPKEEPKTPEVEVENEKEKMPPAKRFPSAKKKEEKKEKEKPAETEEASPQNQVF
ncbi:FHA domain-containing protein [Parabacteroides sp.]|uniref:FHA domain-containing protein n=1 Tax=Parabacteroides sp. TaxID=1869337 RepID=UPI00257DC753|nr:FHA domain-containing protein [Parabacteroides sp.]